MVFIFKNTLSSILFILCDVSILNKAATLGATVIVPDIVAPDKTETSSLKLDIDSLSLYSDYGEPNQMYYTIVWEQILSYYKLSVKSTGGRSPIDASLQLAIDRLLYKYGRLERFIVHCDTEILQILTEDIVNEFEEIRNLSNYVTYNQFGNRHFEFDDLCAVYNELFMYNLGFVEYLFEKQYLIKTLKGRKKEELASILREDYELHSKRHRMFDNAYRTIDMLAQRYKGMPICPFSANREDVRIIQEFKSKMLRNDPEDMKIMIKNYNSMILNYIVDYFPSKNLDLLKRYTEFLRTENNVISVMDKLCQYGCNWEDFVRLGLFIDRFPIENSIIEVYLRYINLIVLSSEFNRKGYDSIILERAIEIKFSDIFNELDDTNSYKLLSLIEAYQVFKNRTLSFKRSIIDNIVSKNVVDIHSKINTYSVYFPNKWIVWGAEKLIQEVLYMDVNANAVSLLIQEFQLPEQRYASYKTLLENILGQGHNGTEMLHVARIIKKERNKKLFAGLKDLFPPEIKYILWNNNNFYYSCTVKNFVYSECLLTVEESFMLGVGWNATEEFPRLMSTCNNDSSFLWTFRHDRVSDSFTLENFRGSYLSAGEQYGNLNYRLQLLSNFQEDTAVTRWKLELIETSPDPGIPFLFRLRDTHDPPRYLYAQFLANGISVRNIFLSPLQNYADESLWSFNCTNYNDIEDEENKLRKPQGSVGVDEEEGNKTARDILNFRDETDIFLSFLERLDIKRFIEPALERTIMEEDTIQNFTKISDTVSDFIRKTSTYLRIQFTELIGFSRFNLMLERSNNYFPYLLYDPEEEEFDDDQNEQDDRKESLEYVEASNEDFKEEWLRNRKHYERLQKTQNYRKINQYKNLLIKEIRKVMLSTLSVYTDSFGYTQPARIEMWSGENYKSFDVCAETLSYLRKCREYLDLYSELAAKTEEKNNGTRISKFLLGVEKEKMKRFSYTSFLLLKYLKYSHITCKTINLTQENKTLTNFDNRKHISFELIIKLTADALIGLKFHLGEVYVSLVEDEAILYYISDYITDTLSSTSSDELNIQHYFTFFVLHLYKTGNINIDTAANILDYSYKRSILTGPLQDTYSFNSRRLLEEEYKEDAFGTQSPNSGLPLSTIEIDKPKIILERLVIDQNSLIMDFAKNIMWKKLNEEQLARLRHRFYYFYRIYGTTRLTISMYRIGDEDSYYYKRIYEFLEYISIYYDSIQPGDGLCWRCPPRITYLTGRRELLLKGYDEVVSFLLTNETANGVSDAVNLADYTHTKFGYIPAPIKDAWMMKKLIYQKSQNIFSHK